MLASCRPTQCRRAFSLLPSATHAQPLRSPSPWTTPSPTTSHLHPQQHRPSSSNSRWKSRQGGDHFVREARAKGLKSRAAFKLLEIDQTHRIFSRGATVVDLGYAPGSWSQVAKERVGPYGIVVGIDLIPHQPPPGVSTIQGDFLSEPVREMAKAFISEAVRQKHAERRAKAEVEEERRREKREAVGDGQGEGEGKMGEEEVRADENNVVLEQTSYIESERLAARDAAEAAAAEVKDGAKESPASKPKPEEKMVSVVLSDMSAPWPQTHGFSINSLSNPYRRMMNTSGNRFRDQAGSMRLCDAAVQFASDVLKPGGNFVCKYYQGPDDKDLEKKLRFLFRRVVRVKPESSRGESMEAFFVGLDKKPKALIADYEAKQRKDTPEYDEADWE